MLSDRVKFGMPAILFFSFLYLSILVYNIDKKGTRICLNISFLGSFSVTLCLVKGSPDEKFLVNYVLHNVHFRERMLSKVSMGYVSEYTNVL